MSERSDSPVARTRLARLPIDGTAVIATLVLLAALACSDDGGPAPDRPVASAFDTAPAARSPQPSKSTVSPVPAELSFEMGEDGRIVDTGTGSVWDVGRGVAVEGPLKGAALQQVPYVSSYHWAWRGLLPALDLLRRMTGSPGALRQGFGVSPASSPV